MKQIQLERSQGRMLMWGSHLPLNISLLKIFPITGVLELGAGINSTPIFFQNSEHTVSIECDLNWINKLRSENIVQEDENHKMYHHIVPKKIVRQTPRGSISAKNLKLASDFYASFISPSINYMFVDCYAGLRLEALMLYENFDFVAYHDAEPNADHYYKYSKFNPNQDYLHYIDKTFLAHTGFLIHKKFENLLEDFIKEYSIQAEIYAKKFDIEYEVDLARVEYK